MPRSTSSGRKLCPKPGRIALYVAAFMRLYRLAYWLEGTVLVGRGVVGNRRCDLATAEVTADSKLSLPRLVVQVRGRRPMVVWLRNPLRGRALLPPDQLHALAAAISRGREHDPRIDPVIDGLRRMAADPFGLGR